MFARSPTLVFLASVVAVGCSGPRAVPTPPGAAAVEAAVRDAVARTFVECRPDRCGMRLDRASAVDSVRLRDGRARVYLNDAFAQVPIREEGLASIRAAIGRHLDPAMHPGTVDLIALGLPVEELVPNPLRRSLPADEARRPDVRPEPRPVVRRVTNVPEPSRGLFGRHIALWQSHGWYWERRLGRWEWQRARLFQTVEDVFPTGFVLPYLVPMLERAGAEAWTPRERDLQEHLVVVDNDGSSNASVYVEDGAWSDTPGAGFGVGSMPYRDRENPFEAGSARFAEAAPGGSVVAEWRPTIPEDGAYAVYVSWAPHDRAAAAAHYTVRHAGGSTRFVVDQRMASGTWVYLGTFDFRSGAGPDSASVRLDNTGDAGTVVTADAVRFGGGMGLVERGGSTSGRPRWTEAARYHLQYSGMPADLVYAVTGAVDDYGDDYRGRGEWVNYLKGAPFGPNRDRSARGLGIPVDLSLAFHTDAGVTRTDSTVGTLMIYSSPGADSLRVFPDGMSRFASRDFADLLQSQIVADIRALHDPAWSRRGLWDRDYSEAFRPNVPAALLELLSHQNFADMRFGLDPRFRITVSRAIYKAMARFLAAQYGEPDPVIQPLAPTRLQARLSGDGRVRLSWRATPDPLEPSAMPDGYVLYTRRGAAAFDDGRSVAGDTIWVPIDAGVDYAFRVEAWNAGGRSAPSETVAAAWVPGAPKALLVSAFDRLSAPASIDLGPWRGFLDGTDHGVADRVELSFVGAQKEFDADVPWRDDDDPGHGASYGDHEATVSAGNTFDYPAVVGPSVRRAGFSVETASDEAVEEGGIPTGTPIVVLLLGEERETTPGAASEPAFAPFPASMVDALRAHADRGGALLVSGSYVGTSLYEHPSTAADAVFEDSSSAARAAFARDVLHVTWRTGRAVREGGVFSVDASVGPRTFGFHVHRNPHRYAAESPDALDPVGDGARTLLRYAESGMSAAVGYEGPHRAVSVGFPIETIVSDTDRDRLVASLLGFLVPRASQ